MATNFKGGLTIDGIPVIPGSSGGGDSSGGSIPTTTGTIYWVSSTDSNASNNNSGLTEAEPLATIAGGADKLASKGDIVLVKEGHTETLTAAVACDVNGAHIIGLGEGTSRPQVTVNGAIDGFNITADNFTIENIYFNEATAAATSNINVAAANVTIRRVHMDCGANDVDAITVTAAGELPIFEDCTVIVTADGPDSWIKFEGVVDRPIIRGNHIIGSEGTNAYDDGVFDFNSQAVTNPAIYGNVFNGGNVATTVVANGGSVTGAAYGPNVYAGSATSADNVASNTEILDQLSGATGVPTFPAATNAANAVSLAEVLRHTQNLAAIEALDRKGDNYIAVTADMTSATWNTVASHEVLTVTGCVRIKMLIECTDTLTDAADGAAIQLGVEGATTAWIGATNAAGAGGATISAGEIWIDTSPTETNANTSSAVLDKVVAGGLDIGYEIASAALTGGALVFHCWWTPISSTGAVVAGAGGAL